MSVNVTPTTRLLMRKVHGFKVMWTCLGWCVFLVLVHPAISNPLLVSGSSLYISANSDNTLCMNRYSGVTTTPPRRLLLSTSRSSSSSTMVGPIPSSSIHEGLTTVSKWTAKYIDVGPLGQHSLSLSSSFVADGRGSIPSMKQATFKNDVDDGGVESAARGGVGDGGGEAPRGGMVGGVGGERLCAGRRRRTMACRRMEYTRRLLGRG